MQQYQFEKIYSRMGNEFGKIRKGGEDEYSVLLLPMEENALKIHREFPQSNSRRLREAIALVLFDIKERYTGEPADTGAFRNEDNERLEKALLMAFDPYTNDKILPLLQKKMGELSQEQLKDYYRIPIMCLLRIKDSVDTWEKWGGPNGYFEFIEGNMGGQIKGSEMDFTIMLPADLE